MPKFLLTLDGKEGSIYSSLARNKSGVIPKWLRRGESEEGGRVYPSRTRRATNDTVKGQTWEPRAAWNSVWTILNGWKFSTQPYFTCNILMNTSSLTLRKSRLRRIKQWVFERSRMRPLESTPIYRNATFEQSMSSPPHPPFSFKSRPVLWYECSLSWNFILSPFYWIIAGSIHTFPWKRTCWGKRNVKQSCSVFSLNKWNKKDQTRLTW